MISELFAKYQCSAIHTVEITDCKVTNRASDLPNLRYHIQPLYLPAPIFCRSQLVQTNNTASRSKCCL